MKTAIFLVFALTIVPLSQQSAAADEPAPIPEDCPVTRGTPENRYTPPSPSVDPDANSVTFLYGSDLLYTALFADGRWRGIRSPAGTRTKSFWYRQNAEWLMDDPYQLKVTYRLLDGTGPMYTEPDVTNAIMGKTVAMLLMLELPNQGCWEVTASYKDAQVSFVTWVE